LSAERTAAAWRGRVAPEGRRPATDVDRDVENRAARNPQQLSLRGGRDLKVQPANRALGGVADMIVLNEVALDAMGCEVALVPDLGEKPTAVADAARHHDLYFRKRRLDELHRPQSSPIGPE
jgi:hypothetical protein